MLTTEVASLPVLTNFLWKYTARITVVKDTIVVEQDLLVTFGFEAINKYRCAGDLVRKTITDTFQLSIDQMGRLVTQRVGESKVDDRCGIISHAEMSRYDLQGHMRKRIIAIGETVRKAALPFGQEALKPIPVPQFQNFMFPGSNVFTYKKFSFSDHQDLMADITYAAPREVAAAATASSLVLTASSELMINYVDGKVFSPGGKFEALQTSSGHSLLFSVDADGFLVVRNEQSKNTMLGWPDSILLHAVVTMFDVRQNAVGGSISLAIVVEAGGKETLHVSLGNSNNDLSWIKAPGWTAVPFDTVGENPPHKLNARAILFAETAHEEYLIVDIDHRQSHSTTPYIMRYYVNPKASGSRWTKHDSPMDIANGSYQSCVGRVKDGLVDGVYTSGTVIDNENDAQIIYIPIKSIRPSEPVHPHRLLFPQDTPVAPGVKPITTIRDDDGKKPSGLLATTDLYAVAGTTLYRWAADGQRDGDVGIALISNPILSDTDTLHSMAHDGIATI